MSILGLDYKLYLKDNDIAIEEKVIAEFVLLDKFELAEKYNFKYLYNGNIDYLELEQYINLLNFGYDDFSSYALSVKNVFEYIEMVYDYSQEEGKVLDDEFVDESFINYIIPIYEVLNDRYKHKIFISSEKYNTNFNDINYFFLDDFKDEKFVLNTLPIITSIEDFYSLFPFYFWFYSKENKTKIDVSGIILSKNFKNQISKLDSESLFNVLTSLFRGVFYPDYLNSKGVIESSEYIIETHPDKNIKSLLIGNKTNSLYRVHCVSLNEKKGGKNRICYTSYDSKVVIFYYSTDHCESLKYDEELKNDLEIFVLNKDKKKLDKDIELKIR
ncbi:MAG: hypothetical protein RBT22_08000 [Aliarcobacter sp.]|jgi:hypothetical protein|nr:hypothetical protein [Aliarcobacter sp.]